MTVWGKFPWILHGAIAGAKEDALDQTGQAGELQGRDRLQHSSSMPRSYSSQGRGSGIAPWHDGGHVSGGVGSSTFQQLPNEQQSGPFATRSAQGKGACVHEAGSGGLDASSIAKRRCLLGLSPLKVTFPSPHEPSPSQVWSD
jgi:hypothetical protein